MDEHNYGDPWCKLLGWSSKLLVFTLGIPKEFRPTACASEIATASRKVPTAGIPPQAFAYLRSQECTVSLKLVLFKS